MIESNLEPYATLLLHCMMALQVKQTNKHWKYNSL